MAAQRPGLTQALGVKSSPQASRKQSTVGRAESDMGFWSTVGKVARAGVEHANKMNQDAKNNVQKYEQEDDGYVKEKFKSGTTTEKMAAARVLKSRGYTKDTL
ncbi:hypothetical protein [Thermomonas aquatica]|uniref:Uncharacterized protein n=1 Tax=Thermomonas aquatica TaxID=2202149 RepID=A0A5B7ZME6_9GAMM|nr:hypothetical protein [Thermomonas aquatica]QDA56454.1 hypothetical protein FHQ07_03570 [Thermomonas aquatica]